MCFKIMVIRRHSTILCLFGFNLFIFRSFAFFSLPASLLFDEIFFAFLLWSQLMENSWIHLSLIHLNSFSLFVVFGIFDFCSTLYQFSEQTKESIVSHNSCVCMIWAKDCCRSSRFASFCSYSDKLHRKWKYKICIWYVVAISNKLPFINAI